ncbi:MAG: hypothetical protein MJZ01_01885, partial [Bacteroidales bacterium]|nr:hypothetical protein [Bacteroidales bacterium]
MPISEKAGCGCKKTAENIWRGRKKVLILHPLSETNRGLKDRSSKDIDILETSANKGNKRSI